MKRTPSRNAASSATLWGWALTGALLGGLLASWVWAPARWVSEALRQVTHQQVQLDSPRGTVWQGSAQITLSGAVAAAMPKPCLGACIGALSRA